MHAKTPEAEIDVPSATRLNWGPAHKQAWHQLQPAGLYFIGTSCPVSGREHSPSGTITRMWGGPFGVLLVRGGLTLAVPWSPALVAPFTKGPTPARLYWRLWTWDEGRIFKVYKILCDVLNERRVEESRNDYAALPHDMRPQDIEAEIRRRAAAVTNMLLNDEELYAYCGGLVRAADARAAKGRRA